MTTKHSVAPSSIVTISLGVLTLGGLYLTSLYSYLLFHSLAEVFSIVVACGVFMVVWNARRFMDHDYFLLLGIAYVYVGAMALIHTLAYPGMNVFQASDTNLAAQVWIAARYVQSLSLLVAPLFVSRKLRANLVLVAYGVVVALLLSLILYWQVFPVSFVEGVGLTPFAIISEYVISLILLASVGLLYLRRREFDPRVLRLLTASILVAAASQLAFTQYADAYATASMIGHLLKIVSFYLIYKAVVETGLVKPYDLLFRSLKKEQEALRESEERYRDLVENVDDVIYAVDAKGVVSYVSPAVESWLGYAPSEIAGREFSRFVLEEDLDVAREGFARVLGGSSGQAGDYRLLTKAGGLRWMRTSSRPILQGDRIVGVRGVLSDITERKRAEEELLEAKEAAISARQKEQERREEAERRRLIAESLADVIAVLNSRQSLDEVLDFIAMQAGRLLGNQAAAIYRLEDDGTWAIEAAQGLPLTCPAGWRMPIGREALRRAIESRVPVAIPDLAAQPSAESEPVSKTESEVPRSTSADRYRALLAVPIIVGDDIYGGIALYYAQPREFPQEEIDLASAFGDQAALAIENARLRDQVGEAAALAERERLARELHDAVTQTLFSAGLIAEALPRVWERDPEQAREGLEELRQLTRAASAEMRALLLELRAAALTEKPLGELLRHLTDAVTIRTRVPVTLTVEGDSSLPPEMQIALYRISQEALNNIVKHAAASEASIDLHCASARVTLTIRDNGRGFDMIEALPDQLGVGIMEERARSIGAHLEIKSRTGRGTRITVEWHETSGAQSRD